RAFRPDAAIRQLLQMRDADSERTEALVEMLVETVIRRHVSSPSSGKYATSASVRFLRHPGAAAADQEIEIGALVGLQHMVDIEALVAALEIRLRRLPGGLALGQLRVRHIDVQPPPGDVELDRV